jgi:transposase
MAQTTPPRVTIGVDTHKHTHVAAGRDQLGRRLGITMAPATAAGYAQLLAWAQGLGEPVAWGVEGTGSYGAGLARFLAAHGQQVVEVNRPDRQLRRRRGKRDPVDAAAAARAVQAGEATSIPRPRTAGWRCCGRCGWPARARSRPAPRPSTPSRGCWSPPRPNSASSWRA